MIIGTIISSITGIATSLFQDWWHHHLAIKQQDKDLEIELKRKAVSLNTTEQPQWEKESILATENTSQVQIQEESKIETKIVESSIKAGQVDMVLPSKLLNCANFFIAITRPTITFLLGGLIAFIQIYSLLSPEKFNDLDNQYIMIVEATFYLFDGTLAFWFMRRSSDKFQFNRYGK